jgi:beta-mannosidase
VLHYVKDIYQPIIIMSYLNDTTGDLTANVTSNLWSEVEGTATFAWYGFNGTLHSSPFPSHGRHFHRRGVEHRKSIANHHERPTLLSLASSFLKMNITATGSLPNPPHQ